MKGLNLLMQILLVCISAALSSPTTASNQITNSQPLLKDLDSDIHKALMKITILRADLVLNNALKNIIYNSQKRKCNDVTSVLKALDEDTKEIQIMQLKGSRITTPSSSDVSQGANKNTKYVDSFRNIEYFLRDIASKIRKLAKDYKIRQIPKYTVGLSHTEVTQVQKGITEAEANRQAYEKLSAMGACIKVFKKEYIAHRLLRDPFQSNRIGGSESNGQQYEWSSNSVF